MKYILASASPRRKELLKQMGLTFEIIPARKEEHTVFTDPREAVMDLSRQKAKEAAEYAAQKEPFLSREEPMLVIGADTSVISAGRILGKPKDEKDAYRMLSMLQGKCHTVCTGVTLLSCGRDFKKIHSFYEETEVSMYPMSEKEILWYIQTKEPFDKAGGYGIQGKFAIFIKEIRGDYNNVVGLPAAKLYQELKKTGIDILQAETG